MSLCARVRLQRIVNWLRWVHWHLHAMGQLTNATYFISPSQDT